MERKKKKEEAERSTTTWRANMRRRVLTKRGSGLGYVKNVFSFYRHSWENLNAKTSCEGNLKKIKEPRQGSGDLVCSSFQKKR